MSTFTTAYMASESRTESMHGMLDEMRISREARSADWVWAKWSNMAQHESFVDYGSVSNLYTRGTLYLFW